MRVKIWTDSRIGSCLLMLMFAAVAPAIAQVHENWVAQVDVNGRSDAGLFTAIDSSGNVIVAGTSATTGSDSEILVVKHDPFGTTVWTRRVAGGSGGDFRPSGLGVDTAGNILLTGMEVLVSSQDTRVVTLKLDPAGLELWRQIFDISGAQEIPAGLVLDGAGGPIVAGHSEQQGNPTSSIVAFVLAYTAGGNLAWQDTYDNGPDQEIVHDLARDPGSGTIYVSGSVSGQNHGVLLLRYDADGRRKWARRYPVRDVVTAGQAVAVDPSGNVLVAGLYQPFNADLDIQVLKVGRDGRMMWSALYGTPGKDDHVVDLASDGAGNAVVAATILGISQEVDRLVLKFLSNGVQAWTAVYDRAGQYDNATALAVDPAGNIYVTGISYELDDPDWATTRYDSSGALVWTSIYEAGPFSFEPPSDLVLGAASAVVITGGIQGDVVTIEYGQP